MPIVVALLLVFLVGATSAGELVRYRTADGAVGFVDDERRLPPDAVVVSRTPLTRPPAAAAAAGVRSPDGEDRGAAGDATGVAAGEAGDDAVAPAADEARADCGAYPERSAQLACWQEQGGRCRHFGLPLRCTPEAIATAERWCDRGESLRSEWTPIEDRLASAVEEHRACKSSSRPGTECSREEVIEAERAVDVWDLRLTALEDQCHEQGCMPGWVRSSCEDSARR